MIWLTLFLLLTSIGLNMFFVSRFRQRGASYGRILVTEDDGGLSFLLELEGDPETMGEHHFVVFKVEKVNEDYIRELNN
jgi:hypothetical protein